MVNFRCCRRDTGDVCAVGADVGGGGVADGWRLSRGHGGVVWVGDPAGGGRANNKAGGGMIRRRRRRQSSGGWSRRRGLAAFRLAAVAGACLSKAGGREGIRWWWRLAVRLAAPSNVLGQNAPAIPLLRPTQIRRCGGDGVGYHGGASRRRRWRHAGRRCRAC